MATITNANTGKFNDKCLKATRDFVLGEYLDAKMANLMGVSLNAINDLTPIRIDSPYNNSEGIIKGYEKEKGLRIDLQKQQGDYACFQVQYGTGGSNGKKGGAYAGVLMLVNNNFVLGHLREALRFSFDLKPVQYARLDP